MIKSILTTSFYCLVILLLTVGCNPDNTGSIDTQQLDNDEDPTKVETEGERDSLSHLSVDHETINGRFVYYQPFNEQEWADFKKEQNLVALKDSSLNQVEPDNIGATAWKPWGEYQYRMVYFYTDGKLNAKPVIRTKNNDEIMYSANTVDSLKIQELKQDIERNFSQIKKNKSAGK